MVIAKIYLAGNAPKEVQLDTATGFTLATALRRANLSMSESQEAKVNGSVVAQNQSIGTKHSDGDVEHVEVVISTKYKGNQVEVLIAAAGNAPTRHVCDHGWTLRDFLESCPADIQQLANLSAGGKGMTFKFNAVDVEQDTILDEHFKDGLNTLAIAKMYKGNSVQVVEFAFGNMIYVDGMLASFQTI